VAGITIFYIYLGTAIDMDFIFVLEHCFEAGAIDAAKSDHGRA